MATIKYLGLERKLRNGGRYGISSTFIKNLKVLDVDDIRAYMDLYMKPEDKKAWDLVYKFSGQVDSTLTGTTKSGIDYVAVTLSNPGKILPFTIFIYETPENKINIYCPIRGNQLVNKEPIPVFLKLNTALPGVVNILQNGYKTRSVGPANDYEAEALEYIYTAHEILESIHPEKTHPWRLSSFYAMYFNSDIKIGPDKIETNFGGFSVQVELGMDYMIEDFESRVVQKSAATVKVAKPKPVVGGTGKELLWIHPDAKDWLSNRFAWKTKGVFTGMTSDDPDVSVEEAKKMDFEESIFQFDKGVLYEDSRTGDRDSAVWRCKDWDDVWFEDTVIEKIKKLYPGIQPSDIFLSDED